MDDVSTLYWTHQGILATYRHLHGFGSQATPSASFINAKNQRHWVKFHLTKPARYSRT
jgi:catalase